MLKRRSYSKSCPVKIGKKYSEDVRDEPNNNFKVYTHNIHVNILSFKDKITHAHTHIY